MHTSSRRTQNVRLPSSRSLHSGVDERFRNAGMMKVIDGKHNVYLFPSKILKFRTDGL